MIGYMLIVKGRPESIKTYLRLLTFRQKPASYFFLCPTWRLCYLLEASDRVLSVKQRGTWAKRSEDAASCRPVRSSVPCCRTE